VYRVAALITIELTSSIPSIPGVIPGRTGNGIRNRVTVHHLRVGWERHLTRSKGEARNMRRVYLVMRFTAVPTRHWGCHVAHLKESLVSTPHVVA